MNERLDRFLPAVVLSLGIAFAGGAIGRGIMPLATGRAREAADQFARDAGSQLSGIRQANQGIFQILPRDQAPGIAEGSQVAKTVRVVSTVDYFLRD